MAPVAVDCPACGQALAAGASFCSACGNQLLRLCPVCGAGNRPNQPACLRCNTPVRPSREDRADSSFPLSWGKRSSSAVPAIGLTPFVGREDERRLLRSRFALARDGEGQVVLLSGAAGIGKSRLARALSSDLLETPHRWIEAGGNPYFLNTPFFATAALVRALLDVPRTAPPDVQVTSLDQALTDAGVSAGEAVPLVAPLLGLDVPTTYRAASTTAVEHSRLLRVLVAWVFGTARRQPLVLLLDDLQWVDPSTLELQAQLAEQGAEVPLFLLYTARPEFEISWPLQSHHTHLTLNRLSAKHVREMVARVARIELAADEVGVIAARTGGVPLFVEELAKLVRDAWTEKLREMPATLAESLWARLQELGAAATAVAQAAAVIGVEFSEALLRAVANGDQPPGDAPGAIEAGLDALLGEGLVHRHGEDEARTYLFKHALVRDAAYHSLAAEQRRALHRRVADVLCAGDAAGLRTPPELLAYHRTEAGDTLPAIDSWLDAGSEAALRGAFNEASGLLKRGLALLHTLPESSDRDSSEFQFLIRLGNALVIADGYGSSEAAVVYERLRDLGARSSDPAQLLLLLVGQWVATIARLGPVAAQPLAAQALELAERHAFPTLLGRTLVGATNYYNGRFAAGREMLSAALAESEDVHIGFDWRLVALAFASHTAWHLGLADEARALGDALVQRADASGTAVDVAFAEHYDAALHVYLRDPQAVLLHARRALAACAEAPNPVNEGVATLYTGWALAEIGEIEEGVAVARDGLDRFIASGQRVAIEPFTGWMADTLAKAGRWEEALAVLASPDEVLPGDAVDHPDALRRRAYILEHTGAEASAVEALYRQALDSAREHGDRAYELRAALAYGRWLCGRGASTEAASLVAPIYAGFTEGFDTLDLVEAREFLDALGVDPTALTPCDRDDRRASRPKLRVRRRRTH